MPMIDRARLAVVVLAGLALCRLIWVLYALYVNASAKRHHLETAWFLFAAGIIGAALLSRRELPAVAEGAPRSRGFVVALSCASFALYWPALSIGALSDDFVLLSQPISGQREFLRPLPLMLWKMVHPIAGAAGLHTMNVALHGLNAALVWMLASRFGGGTGQRWFASLFFVAFPAAVEPVTWSSGIFDVLLVTLTLAYVVLACSDRAAVRMLALAPLVGALLTKEPAVVLPLLLVLSSRLTPDRRTDWRLLRISFGAVAAYVAWRMFMLHSTASPPYALEGYFLKELVGRPFASLVLPWTRAEIQARPFLFGIVPQLVTATLLMVFATWFRGARLLWPALWIVVSVLPLAGYFFVGEALEGSRYLYLPLVAWALVVSYLIEGVATRARIAAYVVFAAIVAAHAAGVRLHLGAWTHAADVRDAVIAAAREAHDRSGCQRSAFRGVPDSVNGVYVFRNGFPQALDRPVTSDESTVPRDCVFTWTGDRFAKNGDTHLFAK